MIAFTPLPGGEPGGRWFPSPEARRLALTSLRGQFRPGKTPAAWLAYSFPFFSQREPRALSTRAVGLTGGNDPLKWASGSLGDKKGQWVCRGFVWGVPGATGGGFCGKRGFTGNREMDCGGVSVSVEAVRPISGARGFRGGSQSLKSPPLEIAKATT